MSSSSGSGPPTSPASQNVPPSTRKYSSLKSAALYQSGRSGSSRIGRLPGLDRRPPVIVPGPARARRDPTPALRSGPSPGCSASTSAGLRRTRPSGSPRRSRTGSTGGRPAARSTVAASAAPVGPSHATGAGSGSSRPSAAKSAHRVRSASGSKAARAVSATPSASSAAMANVPRRAVGPPPGSPQFARRACRPPRTTRCGRPGAGPAPGRGSAQVKRSPTVNGSGPGFSSHHSRTPTGRALDSRSPPITGDSCSPRRRTPPVTSGSKVCHARGNSAWYVPLPAGSVHPQSGSAAGRSADSTVVVDPDGPPTNTANPSAATGSNRCCPTSRCQRAASPRNVRPMLPVPRPPIGTPAHSPSSTIGPDTRGCPTSTHGTPIPRRQATSGIRGRSGPDPWALGCADLRKATDPVGIVTSRRRSRRRRA